MKNKGILIVGAVVLAAVSFYVGMKYGGSSSQPGGGQGSFAQRFGGAGGGGRGAGFGATGSATIGQVLSKDDKSITVKLRDGGSKIVFYSASTKVSKTVDGVTDDVKVGAQVVVAGSANQDGSMTAQSIQLRAALVASSTAAQ